MKNNNKFFDLLANGETSKVINHLRNEISPEIEEYKEIIQLSSRFAEVEREKRLGIADKESISIEINKINNALMSIIDRLDRIENNQINLESLTKLNNKKWFFVIFGVAMSGILFFLVMNSSIITFNQSDIGKTKEAKLNFQKLIQTNPNKNMVIEYLKNNPILISKTDNTTDVLLNFSLSTLKVDMVIIQLNSIITNAMSNTIDFIFVYDKKDEVKLEELKSKLT